MVPRRSHICDDEQDSLMPSIILPDATQVGNTLPARIQICKPTGKPNIHRVHVGHFFSLLQTGFHPGGYQIVRMIILLAGSVWLVQLQR